VRDIYAGFGATDSAPVREASNALATDAEEIVAELDTEFQAAVKVNDASVMDQILHKDMVLVYGNGSVQTREELIEEARNEALSYEKQDEDPGTRVVRVWGDAAAVTARLWIKGVRRNGPAFDRRVWFSDIYIRTATGWRYVFGQVSPDLPDSTIAR
jgi:ketosteroid isomerase-like protein